MKIFVIVIGILAVISLIGWLWMERSLFPKKSTLDVYKESDISLFNKAVAYFYGVRPDLYLKPASWLWLARWTEKSNAGETYHGKVITKTDAAKIIKLDKPVNLPDLEHVVPYRVAKSIILREPLPSISVIECPCRAQKEDACLPRDVCLVVGEPFATFVVEHQKTARKLTVEEALAIIDAEEERGHIHTAWFKESNHDRFYAICNCCSCCCLGMKSYLRGVPRIVHSGYKPIVDSELCTGCGACTDYCYFKAIGEVTESPELDMELCMGCGICVSHCPNEAISLVLAPEKGIPLDIDVLVGN